MNIKKICIMSVAGCLCMGAVHADVLDFYAGVYGGIGGQAYFDGNDASTKSAYSYGAMFGVDLPIVRAEVEYNRFDTKLFSTNTAMANAYFEFLPTPIISPYIGVGAGFQFGGELKDIDMDTDNSWAAQGMLGLTFEIPVTGLNIDAEARAVYLPEITESTDGLHYDLRAKLRYLF